MNDLMISNSFFVKPSALNPDISIKKSRSFNELAGLKKDNLKRDEKRLTSRFDPEPEPLNEKEKQQTLILLYLLDIFATKESQNGQQKTTFYKMCHLMHQSGNLPSLCYVDHYYKNRSQYNATCKALLQTLKQEEIDINYGRIESVKTASDPALRSSNRGKSESPSLYLRKLICDRPFAISLCGGDRKSRYKEEFEEIETLGKGGFGSVYKVLNRLDGCYYAVKKIKLKGECVLDLENNPVFREVRCLARLDSNTHVVRYHASWVEGNEDAAPSSSTTVDDLSTFEITEEDSLVVFSDSVDSGLSQLDDCSPTGSQENTPSSHSISPRSLTATLYIKMQLCDTTLFEWLDIEGRTIDRTVNLDIFKQIVNGLEYVHDNGLIHRDIKPANIFINHRPGGLMEVKLGDFGLAKQSIVEHPRIESHVSTDRLNISSDSISSSPSRSPGSLSSISPPSRRDRDPAGRVGTRSYSAPETVDAYTPKADIFSLGIVLFEMFTLFGTKMERAKVLTDLRKGHFSPLFLSSFPREAELVQSMLKMNPEERPSAADIRIWLDRNARSTAVQQLDILKQELKEKEDIISEQEKLIARLQQQLQQQQALQISPSSSPET